MGRRVAAEMMMTFQSFFFFSFYEDVIYTSLPVL
jgi:hypothetical protein